MTCYVYLFLYHLPFSISFFHLPFTISFTIYHLGFEQHVIISNGQPVRISTYILRPPACLTSTFNKHWMLVVYTRYHMASECLLITLNLHFVYL